MKIKEIYSKHRSVLGKLLTCLKKRTADITSIEIPNKTAKNSFEIASEFIKRFTSFAK